LRGVESDSGEGGSRVHGPNQERAALAPRPALGRPWRNVARGVDRRRRRVGVVTDLAGLQTDIEELAATPEGAALAPSAVDAIESLLYALEGGTVRSASKGDDNVWRANAWVKRGILLGFRVGRLKEYDGELSSVDKDSYPIRRFKVEHNVRLVPGGSSIRRGTYVAPGVVCMPPMYVNVGAYVDTGTMVDSHALIGSCAQIGKRVHISAAA